MSHYRRFLGSALLAIGLCLAVSAMATNALDLKVGLRVLPLLTNKVSGTVVAAIVYDPASGASKTEADTIKSIIDGGLEMPGGIKLASMLVGVGDLEKLSGAKLAFVTQGLSAAAVDAMSKAAAGYGVLTISTDLDYVKANKCVLGVVSSPSVQIFYSSAAADAGKISFAEAFTMLVNQI